MESGKAKENGSPEEAEKLTTPTSDSAKNGVERQEDEKEAPAEQSKLLEATNEVKFIAADSQNGDAKIDIENVRITFSGMNKEELMKYANDPFWVRLRWFLFILFWAAWVAMLAGSIAIIFFAPKCPAPAPREWWEQGPLAIVDIDNYSPDGIDKSGNLQSLTSGLDDLEDLGITGIVLSSILLVDPNGAGVLDFKDVDPSRGTITDFQAFSQKAKDKGIKVILSMPINHVSVKHEWFTKSEAKDGKYADYFVWVKGKTSNEKNLPNNWLSFNGGSAWEWSKVRNEYYLHQFAKNQADFNFRNDDVVAEFKEIFMHWRKLGVSGFRIEDASYLIEDKNKEDERISQASDQKPGSTHADRGFYSHFHTENLPENVELLSKLKKPLVASEDDKGIFAADISNSDNSGLSHLVEYYGKLASSENVEEPQAVVVELPLFNLPQHLPRPKSVSATKLRDTILSWIQMVPNGTWPNWLIPDGLITNDLDSGFHMAITLLEGTPLTSYGVGVPDNLASNSTEMEERRKLMKGLSEARKSPSILYGHMDMKVIDEDILAYTREKSGNPGYLVVLNLGKEDRKVNVGDFHSIPDELSVQLRSVGFKNDDVQEKSKVPRGAIPLPAHSGLVLTFVPQKH